MLRNIIMAGAVLMLAGCFETYDDYKDIGVMYTFGQKDYRVVRSRVTEKDRGKTIVSHTLFLYPADMPPSAYRGDLNATGQCNLGSEAKCQKSFRTQWEAEEKLDAQLFGNEDDGGGHGH